MNTDEHSHNPFHELASQHQPSPKLKKKVLASTRFALLLENVLKLYPSHITDLIIEYVEQNK